MFSGRTQATNRELNLSAQIQIINIEALDIQTGSIKAKAHFTYVPEAPNLYGWLKASEYLRFMARFSTICLPSRLTTA